MKSQESGIVQNRLEARTVMTAIVIHVVLAIMTVGLSLVFSIIIGFISKHIVDKEIAQLSANANQFKRFAPFARYGNAYGSYRHVYAHDKQLSNNLRDAIEQALVAKTPIEALRAVTICDIDKNLVQPESRDFYIADAGQTQRGTAFTVVINQSNFGDMQSIEWQVLAAGFIDDTKKFNFIVYSLFSFPFWYPAYMRKEHDILSGLRSIYSSTYNEMDSVTQIRCLHEAVFDAMIKELEKHGVDTSGLKAQKMETMNISISGGKVSMGNIVQGAMNKVTSNTQAKAAA